MTPPPAPGPDLERFLAVYDPEVAALALALRELMYEEAPGLNELVYGGPYALAIAFTICATLPVAALVDQFYAEVQAIGGGRQDTSALVRRLKKV